jgi:cation:H+ antiporter
MAIGLGISTFVFVQWVAPFLSEFPEKVSAFNWARRVTTAPMALMNMVSSNINQWTMLVAMLPIVYAISLGRVETIVFDEHQRLEILLTIGQSLLGAFLLANMRFAWWESSLLFALWGIQFVLSGFEKPLAIDAPSNSLALGLASWLSIEAAQVERVAARGKEIVTLLYFIWAAALVLLLVLRRRGFEAFPTFRRLMREHW